MFEACRPAGRLFYLVLAVAVAASSVRLAAREVSATEAAKPSSSPKVAPRAADPAPHAASPSPQSGPTLTSVIDTVYTADGAPAQGVLIITWPAFVTASGSAVAAGALNVTLGTNGALNVALAANAAATPAGVYYSVVYQLGPGQVRTEYWVVPTTSPVTVAQVLTTPGSGTAAQPVSMQYVNSALAAKANDIAVVHLAGTETVTGTKVFSVPPNVPAPVGTGDVANKAYVDSSIATVGAGNFLATAGGTMTGPLTLSGNPTAPLQAAAKQYVDTSVTVKADLISGLVPTNELGSGTASGLNCLLGSGTWGPCGSSANATAIQSVPVAAATPTNGQVLAYSSTSGQYAPATVSGAGGVSVTPAASQNIAQPLGTQFSANNISGIRYVTASDNWSTSPSGSLAGGTAATVTLTPCPVGVDTSGFSMYYVYISVQGTPEPAMVTGGTCVAGAASGTIIFTPRNSHSAGYKISSASSGIQEAINDACGLPSGVTVGNPNARVVLPATGTLANAIPVYGSVYAHCSRTLIEGNGALLSCSTRDRCMVLGDLVSSNHYGGVTVRGVNFTSTVRADGCQVTHTQRQSNVVTITTASACATIQNGDIVNINFTDNPAYWGNHGPVTVTGTSITYAQTAANLASVSSPGTIAIENAAIEDNVMPGTIEDIKSSSGGGGNFNQFIVEDDDEAATIRGLDADGSQQLTCDANHCGSYVYAANGGAPVIWLDKANISPQCGGNGVTVYNNNTVRITDSVIQGFGMWAENTQTLLGNYGGTDTTNVYMEEGAGPCPHPYNPGAGSVFSAAGIIWGDGSSLNIHGGQQPAAHLPEFTCTGTGCGGSMLYTYYVVVHDVTAQVNSFPLLAGYAGTSGTGTINGQFPHVPPENPGDVVTYDVVRMSPMQGVVPSTTDFPSKGLCNGGSATACGSIILAQAQCSGLLCTFTDTASASTSGYTTPSSTWSVQLPFWPAALLIDGDNAFGSSSPVLADLEMPDVVDAANGVQYPRVFLQQCNFSDQEGTVGGAWKSCREFGTNAAGYGASIIYNAGVPAGQGRLNFMNGGAFNGSATINAGHIITLVNSIPLTTLATYGFRPPASPNDTYIGLDAGGLDTAAQLAFGAPVAISNYIGNTGDNSSYKERLTAVGKTFNVPVNINGNLTVTGTCTGCGGSGGGSGTVNSGSATQLALYSANGAAVSGDSGLTDSGTTLNYSGSNGIAAAAGTFSGNVTVNGQLLVAGPWTVSSPVPGTAMAPAAAGTSALGISNDGNYYISANAGTPQKVATTATSSFYSNLFQEDANDLGEYGTVAQNLHVYSSYTNSSTWQRISMGYDPTDNYAVLRSESLPSGNALGLGLWINNGLKWVIDASSNFKPWTDQTYNIGSFSGSSGTGLRPGTVYVAGNATTDSGFELGKFANESYEICNDATTGTIVNGLALLTTGGCAAKPASALTSGAIGVVIATAGTTGVATLARAGSAFCSFDGTATVVGDYVVPSSTVNAGFYPLCHDAGATRPTGTQILGRVLQASAGSATVQMFLDMPGSNVSSSGAGTGSCTNQAVTALLTGAPTCSTITSAYVDSSIAASASPALSGTPTAPTAAANTNTTQIATTAFVLGQASGTTPSMNGTAAVGTSNTFARADHVHPTDTSRAALASPALTGTPTAPTATTGDNSTKIATTAYVRSETYLTWSCAVAGTTAVTQYCNWTLPAGVTVTGFDLAASTAAAGCTTFPVLQIWDGTSAVEVGSYSIALTSGTSFFTQVTGSTSVVSGHQLRFKITTAAAGCTTNPAGIVATLTYQMQN